MDRHPLMFEVASLDFVAVDDEQTRVREDAFFFREMPYGFDLFIASVLPHIMFANDELIDLSLRTVIETGKNFDEDGNAIYLFDKRFMLANCLTLHHHQPAVVARYAVDKECGIQNADITVGKVKLTRTLSYQEYNELPEYIQDSHRVKAMLDELLVSDPVLRMKIDTYLSDMKDRRQVKNIVLGTLSLFNHACTLAAKKEKVPFFRTYGYGPKRRFELCPRHATFNRPFRDPVGLINLTNLSRVIEEKPPLFSKLDLKKTLPRHPLWKSRFVRS